MDGRGRLEEVQARREPSFISGPTDKCPLMIAGCRVPHLLALLPTADFNPNIRREMSSRPSNSTAVRREAVFNLASRSAADGASLDSARSHSASSRSAQMDPA